MNYEYQETYEFQPEFEYEGEGEFNQEAYENELAHELMGIQNEQELEYFLGGLLKKAWGGAKALYNSPMGQQIKGQAIAGLKSLGRQALPGLGSALGGRFLGAQGAQLGGRLGGLAARGLGLEFEGAAPQDRRFEGSKRLVRVARAAARRIMAHHRSGKPLSARFIRGVIVAEGRRHFSGLPAASGSGPAFTTTAVSGGQSSGTWIRQGNRIIVQGV
jgi:hypothetical protein